MAKGVSGPGVAAAAIGGIFLWSAIKGASVPETIRALLKGEQPTGETLHPITPQVEMVGALGTVAGMVAPGANAQKILAAAAKRKGEPYCFGGGHSRAPCSARCKDCSGYVSCVLNEVGLMKGSKATGQFASFGTGVPYANRAPGDLIVWNGGPAGGHMGIIATVSGNGGTMWNSPCTGCGGVKLSKYPYGSRTSKAAVIRRV
jgi:cell wall-associated NlpC family hydrolase